MRSTILPFLFCLTVWAVALPQTGGSAHIAVSEATAGGLLTVTVTGAPATTKSAFFDLGPEIHGLQLYSKGNGTWEGSFALLPSMAGRKFQPQAQLYNAQRQPIPVTGKGTAVQVASSTSQQPGLVTKLPNGRTGIAFDEKIRLDTIEVRSRGDKVPAAFKPELSNNLIMLPSGIAPADVVSVSALNLQGARVEIAGPASKALVMSAR